MTTEERKAASEERSVLGTLLVGVLLAVPLTVVISCGCLVVVVRLRREVAQKNRVFRELRDEIERENERERTAAAENQRAARQSVDDGRPKENIALEQFKKGGGGGEGSGSAEEGTFV